ncbi:putative oxidoreductase [Naematelia encephala]|uniref:Putative oxidoreductase n=1 Tax=Naematelia encephala TaxID=71784 RepID=A0A1Y2B7I5_9TREE|nr:putative oxidoreductase [Naematelia encephala]
MPTVLITGITGFLAPYVALSFLTRDWKVHATLRSDSKKAAVEASPLGPYISSGQLELFVTGSLETGDYSKAIAGVDAVVHTASPVEFSDKDFETVHLAPALEGTKRVMDAAVKEESVKAVVYTSTYGAVGNHRIAPWAQAGVVLNEENWNPYTREELNDIDKNGWDPKKDFYNPGSLFYAGSKKYAELAAWEIKKTSGAKWSLASMNPTMIYGAPIQPQTSLSQGGMSTEIIYALLSGQDKPISPTYWPYYVDVRDCAEAHYQAVIKQATGRFLLAARAYDFQEIADKARELYPNEAYRICKGTPGKYTYKDPGVYILDTTRSREILGIKYRSFEDTTKFAFDRILELEKAGLK